MTIMRSCTIVMAVFLASIELEAQPVFREYRTMNGEMTITGRVGDSTRIMKSNRLVISLNYETAEMIIRVNKSTITTNLNTVTTENMVNSSTEVLFKGELGLDYVITEKHPPLHFEVKGYLYNGKGRTRVEGKGQLVHIHANEYACLLNMDFEVEPELLAMDWPGEEKVQIQIIQTVLKPSTD